MKYFQYLFVIFLVRISPAVSLDLTAVTDTICDGYIYGVLQKVDCTVKCIELQFASGYCDKRFKQCECIEFLDKPPPVYTTAIRCDNRTQLVKFTELCTNACKAELNYSFGYCDGNEDKCKCSKKAVAFKTTDSSCYSEDPDEYYDEDIPYCKQQCDEFQYSDGYCNVKDETCMCVSATDVSESNIECVNVAIQAEECQGRCKNDFHYSNGYCVVGLCQCSIDYDVPFTLQWKCETSLLTVTPQDTCIITCTDLGYSLTSCNRDTKMCQCSKPK